MKAALRRIIGGALSGVGVFLVANGVMDQPMAEALITALSVGGAQAIYGIVHKGLERLDVLTDD